MFPWYPIDAFSLVYGFQHCICFLGTLGFGTFFRQWRLRVPHCFSCSLGVTYDWIHSKLYVAQKWSRWLGPRQASACCHSSFECDSRIWNHPSRSCHYFWRLSQGTWSHLEILGCCWRVCFQSSSSYWCSSRYFQPWDQVVDAQIKINYYYHDNKPIHSSWITWLARSNMFCQW